MLYKIKEILYSQGLTVHEKQSTLETWKNKLLRERALNGYSFDNMLDLRTIDKAIIKVNSIIKARQGSLTGDQI